MTDFKEYDESDNIRDSLDLEDGDKFLVEIIQEESWDEARKYLFESLLERIAEIEGETFRDSNRPHPRKQTDFHKGTPR